MNNALSQWIPSSSLVVVLLVVIILGVVLTRMVRHAPPSREAIEALEAARERPRDGSTATPISAQTNRARRGMSMQHDAGSAPRRSLSSKLAAQRSRGARKLRATALIALFAVTLALAPFAVLGHLPAVVPLIPAAALVGLVVYLRKSDVRQQARIQHAYALQALVAETQKRHQERAERLTREVLDRAAAEAVAAVGNGKRARHAVPQDENLSGRPERIERIERAVALASSQAELDVSSAHHEIQNKVHLPKERDGVMVPAEQVPATTQVRARAVLTDTSWLEPLPRPLYQASQGQGGPGQPEFATVLDATETAAMRAQEATAASEPAGGLPRSTNLGRTGELVETSQQQALGMAAPARTAALDVTQLLRQRRANAS